MSEKTSPVARELPGYGAWLADNGAYVDIALQYGYYDQDISALDNTRRNGYKAFFVEPQLQFAWLKVNGADFKTGTGMSIDTGSTTFATGRAGLAHGRDITLDDGRALQFAVRARVKHEFDGKQTLSASGTDGVTRSYKADLSGSRVYYGLTADYVMSDKVRLWASVNREESDDDTMEWDARAGVKVNF